MQCKRLFVQRMAKPQTHIRKPPRTSPISPGNTTHAQPFFAPTSDWAHIGVFVCTHRMPVSHALHLSFLYILKSFICFTHLWVGAELPAWRLGADSGRYMSYEPANAFGGKRTSKSTNLYTDELRLWRLWCCHLWRNRLVWCSRQVFFRIFAALFFTEGSA